MAITPDGQNALSGSSDCTLKFWDLRTGEVLRTLTGHTKTVSAVSVTPDGRQAALGLQRRHHQTLGPVNRRGSPDDCGALGPVVAVAVTRDGRQAFSASYYGTVKLWDLASGQVLQVFAGHDEHVTAAVVSHDGRQVFTGSLDASLKLRDLATGQPPRRLRDHNAMVTAVAVTLDCCYGLSASEDLTLRLWDMKTGEFLRTYSGL